MENCTFSKGDIDFITSVYGISIPKTKKHSFYSSLWVSSESISEEQQVFLAKVNDLWENTHQEKEAEKTFEFDFPTRQHVLSRSTETLKTYLAFADKLNNGNNSEVSESIKKIKENIETLNTLQIEIRSAREKIYVEMKERVVQGLKEDGFEIAFPEIFYMLMEPQADPKDYVKASPELFAFRTRNTYGQKVAEKKSYFPRQELLDDMVSEFKRLLNNPSADLKKSPESYPHLTSMIEAYQSKDDYLIFLLPEILEMIMQENQGKPKDLALQIFTHIVTQANVNKALWLIQQQTKQFESIASSFHESDTLLKYNSLVETYNALLPLEFKIPVEDELKVQHETVLRRHIRTLNVINSFLTPDSKKNKNLHVQFEDQASVKEYNIYETYPETKKRQSAHIGTKEDRDQQPGYYAKLLEHRRTHGEIKLMSTIDELVSDPDLTLSKVSRGFTTYLEEELLKIKEKQTLVGTKEMLPLLENCLFEIVGQVQDKKLSRAEAKEAFIKSLRDIIERNQFHQIFDEERLRIESGKTLLPEEKKGTLEKGSNFDTSRPESKKLIEQFTYYLKSDWYKYKQENGVKEETLFTLEYSYLIPEMQETLDRIIVDFFEKYGDLFDRFFASLETS